MGSDERPLRAAMGFGGHARQPHIVENPCIFSLQLERLAASSSCGAFARAARRFQSLWCLSEKIRTCSELPDNIPGTNNPHDERNTKQQQKHGNRKYKHGN